MPTYRGSWTARVDQEFEVEAKDEDEAREFVFADTQPDDVVELIDIEIASIEEV